MSGNVTVLHLADLHLDTVFGGMSGEAASRRNAELRYVFGKAMKRAAEIKADIVLLAGDLFDRGYCSRESAELLMSSMEALPDCRFVISPGNHDPYVDGSFYKSGRLPKNCYVFDSEEVKRFSFPEINTDVYGYAFTSPEYAGDPLRGFRTEHPERLNLLCAHCLASDVGAAENIPVITPRMLSESGFDYAAFGHIHGDERIARASDSLGIAASMSPNVNTLYAYSGCIAGRDIGECGRKGGIVLRAELTADGGKKLFAEREVFCPWVYRLLEVDVSGASGIHEITERVRAVVAEGADDELDTRYRITLTGALSVEARAGYSDIAAAVSVRLGLGADAEIKDETACAYDLAALESDYTVKGVFYRLLKERLLSEDEDMRSQAMFALELGLCALDGGNPWDVNICPLGE